MINTRTHTHFATAVASAFYNGKFHSTQFHYLDIIMKGEKRGAVVSSKLIRWLMWGDNICTFVWLDTKYPQISHCIPLLQKFSPCKTVFSPLSSLQNRGLREKKEGDEMTGCGGVHVPVPTCLCKTSVGRVRFVILNIIAIKQPKPNLSLCKGASAIIEWRFKGKGHFFVNMNRCSQPI